MNRLKRVGRRDVGPIIIVYLAILSGAAAYDSRTWWMTALLALSCYFFYRVAQKLDGKD